MTPRSSLARSVLVLAVFAGACAEGSRESEQAVDTAAGAAESATSAGSMATASTFIDPNTASREELRALPGMDSTAADAVIRGRPYENMLRVDGALAGHLTEAERDSVYTRLWTPIDLNRASGDEILLIPGVGSKMRHEFEEYRPYQSMAKFRREIGKYVDSAEVARLERYVTIR